MSEKFNVRVDRNDGAETFLGPYNTKSITRLAARRYTKGHGGSYAMYLDNDTSLCIESGITDVDGRIVIRETV